MKLMMYMTLRTFPIVSVLKDLKNLIKCFEMVSCIFQIRELQPLLIVDLSLSLGIQCRCVFYLFFVEFMRTKHINTTYKTLMTLMTFIQWVHDIKYSKCLYGP